MARTITHSWWRDSHSRHLSTVALGACWQWARA